MSDLADLRPDLSGVGAVIATATAAKVGSTVSATINGVVVTVQVSRDLSVALGDIIVILKIGSQWVAIGRMFTAAPLLPENDIPPSPVASVTGVLTALPVETRTYQVGRGWRSDTSVFQGEYAGTGNRTGSVFYGGTPRSIVGATVTSAYIHVRRDSGGAFAAQATTMRLMTQSVRPAGVPTLGASTAGPTMKTNTSGTFAIPTSWAQSMVDGTAGGLAFFTAGGSPYVQFAGLGDWGPAFTMIVGWSR